MASIPSGLLPYLTGAKTDYSVNRDSITTVSIVILVIAGVTTSVRYYVRFIVLRSPGLDDLWLAIAFLFLILLCTSCLIGKHFGLGKHLWNLSTDLEELPHVTGRVIKSLYGAYLSYATAITFAKLSIITLYLRIFPRNHSRDLARNILFGTLVFTTILVIGFWICGVFAIIFTCIPVRAAWDFTISRADAKCFHVVDFFYVSAAFNILTDLLLCFLPLPALWALKMPRAQRIVLCCILSMGTFACIASILRLGQLHYLNDFDVSYATVTSLNWSVIEVGTAITCTSLSALRPLAARYLPRLFSHMSQYPQTNNVHPSQAISGSRKEMQSISHDSTLRNMTMDTIVVERTFDMGETKEQPGSTKLVDENGRSDSRGMFDHLAPPYRRSSEEELVGNSSLEKEGRI